MKKIISFLIGLTLCLLLNSCMTAQAQVDDAYDVTYGHEVNFTLVISNGIPYYNADGLLLYYLYDGWYYYPYYYNSMYYFHRYRKPLLHYQYHRYYKPLPRDFHKHGNIRPNGRFDRRPFNQHPNNGGFNRTPNVNNRQRTTHGQVTPNNRGNNRITPNGSNKQPNIRPNNDNGRMTKTRPSSPTRISPTTRTSTRGRR